MFKNKKSFSLILIFVCMFICSGCFLQDFFNHSTKQEISAPVIKIENEVISFNEVLNAGSYEIYLFDSVLSDVVCTNDGLGAIKADISKYVTTYGSYIFKVKAIATEGFLNSPFSNSEMVICGQNIQEEIKSIGKINYLTNLAPTNITVGTSYVAWEVVKNAIGYVTIIELKNQIYYIKSNTNSVDISYLYKKVNTNQIASIRVGTYFSLAEPYEINISKTCAYYNPLNIKGYTDKIYVFDGGVYDYYIENEEELDNLVYYSFIERIENFDFKLSESFYNEIINKNTSLTKIENINTKIDESWGKFLETCYYSVGKYFKPESKVRNYADFKNVQNSNYEINMDMNYSGVVEPDLTIKPLTFREQEKLMTYYDISKKPSRAKDFNDFKSDKNLKTVQVSTSEELYWAVEQKVTPLVVENSRADIIYKKAKETLNLIIKEGMTDYEKALCIFDWIASTTSYDHSDYPSSIIFTKLPCFYLEGVFLSKISVCDGYSKAFALMCNMEGIDCVRIVGGANGPAKGNNLHAWNKIKIDQKWYFVDITWTEIDDSVFIKPTESSPNHEFLTHKYFMVSDNYTKLTHYPYEKRVKFANYVATDINSYYKFMSFKYAGKDFDYVMNKEQLTSQPHFELEEMFRYALENKLKNIEVIIDNNYLDYILNNTFIGQGQSQFAKLRETLRLSKFATQYLQLTPNFAINNLNELVLDNETIYGQNNYENGVIVVIQFTDNLIDEISELGKLVQFLRDAKISDFEIIVDETLLNSFSSNDKMKEFLDTVLNAHESCVITKLNNGIKEVYAINIDKNNIEIKEYAYRFNLKFSWN